MFTVPPFATTILAQIIRSAQKSLDIGPEEKLDEGAFYASMHLNVMLYFMGEETNKTRHPYLMHDVCTHGDIEIIKLMLQHGADVNETDGENGYSGLINAAENNKIDVAVFLIENGADYKYRTVNQYMNQNAMERALEECNYKLVVAMNDAIVARRLKEYNNAETLREKLIDDAERI